MTTRHRSIYDQIPGYAELRMKRDRLFKSGTPGTRFDDPEQYVADALLAALATGAELDWFGPAREAVDEQAVVVAARGGKRLALQHLDGELEALVTAGTDHVLRALDRDLATTLAQVRKLPKRHQLRTLEAAVDADRLDDFRKLEQLLNHYAGIRGDQRHELARHDGGQPSQLPEAAVLRSVDKVFPLWPIWRSHGVLVDDSYGTNEQLLTPPWPTRAEGSRNRPRDFAEDSADGRFLLWAVDNDVPLWVPDRSQLEAEEARLADVLERRPITSKHLPAGWADPRAFKGSERSSSFVSRSSW